MLHTNLKRHVLRVLSESDFIEDDNRDKCFQIRILLKVSTLIEDTYNTSWGGMSATLEGYHVCLQQENIPVINHTIFFYLLSCRTKVVRTPY